MDLIITIALIIAIICLTIAVVRLTIKVRKQQKKIEEWTKDSGKMLMYMDEILKQVNALSSEKL